jgi:soluble P-type ATPase
MISIKIPGWGDIDIENIVLDLNGTIATDGKIPPEVKEKVNALAEKAKVYILTADTQGTANDEMRNMNVEWAKVSGENSTEAKMDFFKSLSTEKSVAIANGSNDQLILKEAALGIAVLGEEGLSITAMKNADMAVRSISDALSLFLKPKRLIATLRE